MLENRSFDHLFGFLTIDQPAVRGDRIDGLTGFETNVNLDGTHVEVSDDAAYAGDFRVDPGHHFPDVNIQLFERDPVPDGAVPTMGGFVRSYGHQPGNHDDPARAARIMKGFAPGRLPVLTGLAREFAVCDRWFSSVPGPTLPNRAFAHAATSLGHVDMNPVAYFNVRTLYEALDDRQVTSRIYSFDGNSLAFTFRSLFQSGNRFLGTFNDFLDDLDGDDLPSYCFIEPRFNDWYDDANHLYYVASDQHPDNNVLAGDNLIADVYEALRASDYWTSSLLVIVYDEHGGFFDHVRPPDGVPSPDQASEQAEFTFTRLGVRVPAVLVSPWIAPGAIVHTRLEHASLAATARALLAPRMPHLTARDAAAETFTDVLTLTRARSTPKKFRRKPDPQVEPNTHGSGPLTEYQWTQLFNAYQMDMTRPADRRVLGRDVAAQSLQDIDSEQQAAEYIRKVAASFGT